MTPSSPKSASTEISVTPEEIREQGTCEHGAWRLLCCAEKRPIRKDGKWVWMTRTSRIARDGETEFAAIVRNRSGVDSGEIDFGLKHGEIIDSLSDHDKQSLVDTAYALARACEEATGKHASASEKYSTIVEAFRKVRPDEWEYIIKTFENGSDRQWALSGELRKAVKLLNGEEQ